MEYKLGRIVDHDPRSRNFALDTSAITIVNTKHERLIPILDQGQIGSCTGNAGIGAINTAPFVQSPNPIFTPDEKGALSLYSLAEKVDGGVGYPPQDNGSSGLSIAKVLYSKGIISSYQHTFTLDDALKALSKYPIITGTNWHSDMFTPDADGRVHPTGSIEGGHEYEGIEIDADNKRIWFCNSWGENWGVKGKFYMTWEDFATLLSQQGDVTVLFPKEITPPTPVAVNPVLRIGSKSIDVKILQIKLNSIMGTTLVTDGNFGPKTQEAVIAFQKKYNLTHDGIVGKMTWNAFSMIEIITSVCNKNGVEPMLGIAVVTWEGGLGSATSTLKNTNGSVDRGLFQINNQVFPEVTDALAFNPTQATQWFCNAVLGGHLHGYWYLSQPNWIKMLTPEIISKYHL